MKDKNLSVSIIIVTWNSENDISDCLESLIEQDYKNIDSIIVVDNCSSDKTVEVIESKFKSVDLLKQQKNHFFTGGNNIGIDYALKTYMSDYVLLINPDTKSDINLISTLLEEAKKDSKIGAIGPKILFWGNENEGKINSAGMIYDGFNQAYDRGVYEEDKGQYDKTEEVESISGCCMLIKSNLLKETGGFWLPLKMYLEEVELCIRIKKKGYKIIYTPKTTIGHKWMQSTSKNKLVKVEKWKRRNWLLIAIRHYPLKSKFAMIRNYFTG